jgi:hypothetical protein
MVTKVKKLETKWAEESQRVSLYDQNTGYIVDGCNVLAVGGMGFLGSAAFLWTDRELGIRGDQELRCASAAGGIYEGEIRKNFYLFGRNLHVALPVRGPGQAGPAARRFFTLEAMAIALVHDLGLSLLFGQLLLYDGIVLSGEPEHCVTRFGRVCMTGPESRFVRRSVYL